MDQVGHKYEALMAPSRVTNQAVNRVFPVHQLARKVEQARLYMAEVKAAEREDGRG